MKIEDLTALEISEEVAKKVIKLADGEAKEANKKIKELESDLKTTNDKLNEKKDEDIEKVKVEEYERGKKEVQDEFDKFKNDIAIDSAISKSGVKDIKVLKALLDMEKVSVKDGEVSGLTEQIDAIKAEKDYLFNSDDGGKPSFTGKTGGGNNVTKEQFVKMSYKEKLDLFNTNKELYESLSQ